MSGPRYNGWTHSRVEGDAGSASPLMLQARKLLGFLAGQRQLSGVKTVTAQHAMPDGSVVRASFIGDIPSVEVFVNGKKVEAPLGVLQGVVLRPQGSAVNALDEAMLSPGPLADDDTRPWRTRYYDNTHLPAALPAKGGYYAKTTRHDALFPQGLALGGNLDWRSADGTVVVTFFGHEDRYGFNNVSGTPLWGQVVPARLGGNYATPYSTLVMINGDVVMDFADHPDYSTFATVNGACVRDGNLVWCVMLAHDYIAFYMAPLRPKGFGYEWATGPAHLGPRFQRIDHTETTLLYSATPDLFGMGRGPVFAFNQSATEGRMIYDKHEVVFNFADLNNLVFTDTDISDPLPVIAGDNTVSLTTTLNGWETTTNDGYRGIVPVRTKAFARNVSAAHGAVANKIAVDYKDDVPVYLEARQPLATSRVVTSTADPVCTPGVDEYSTSNSTSSTTTTQYASALVFPWGLEIALSGTHHSTHLGSSTGFFSDTTLADFTGSFINASSTKHAEYNIELVYLLYCDLRTDTAVYGKLTTAAVEDITYTGELTTTGGVLGPVVKTTKTDHDITRTLELVVHAHGEDLALSAPQLVLDDFTSDTTVVNYTLSLGTTDAFLSAAHDTGPGFNSVDGLLAMSASADQAYAPQRTDIITDTVAAGVGGEAVISVTPPAIGDQTAQVGLQWIPDAPWDVADPTIQWLFRDVVMPWATKTIDFSVPLADPLAAPYDFVRKSFGAWQVFGDAAVFSMPWPVGTAAGYLSKTSGANFLSATGLSGSDIHLPMWLMSRFQTR